MKKNRILVLVIPLLILYIYISNITLIPNEIVLINNEKLKLKKLFGIEITETISTSTDEECLVNADVTLFGKKVKNVIIERFEKMEVVPIGKIIGMRLYTKGVLIVGMSQVENVDNELIYPLEDCDICEGDTILKINDSEINTIDELRNAVNKSNGDKVEITLKRDENIVTSNIVPVKTEENEYRLGLWVKEAATGIGTISYYDKNTGNFAALGHGIIDSDTDRLIEIESGEILTTDVISIEKAQINEPGEIVGKITNQKVIGNVEKNTEFGIYGKLTNLASLNINTDKSIEVATREEICVGDAKIICSLNGENSKEYDIKIEKVYSNNNYDNKSMKIRITDEELLEQTGGIIRGLSGAPIVQNGKFIGCVTNVLVANPEIGYAVFGDIMIKEMKKGLN